MSYYFSSQRVEFSVLESAECGASFIIEGVLDRIRSKLKKAVEAQGVVFHANRILSFVTVYPKDVGENLNHLDPLRPRFGLEIEMRLPV